MVLALRQGPKYLSEIARESGATYVHVKHLADLFMAKGIITLEKKGKNVYARLTDKGERLAKLLASVMEIEGVKV